MLMHNHVGELNPNYIHGLRKTRLYRIHANMKSRCYNPKVNAFESYGGRGIQICEEWKNNFKSFYDWSMSNGYSDDLSIDRIDNDKGYCPDNCRWISSKQQSNNRRCNHIVSINGEERTLMEWSEYYKINYKTVRDRLKRGWSMMNALTLSAETKFTK